MVDTHTDSKHSDLLSLGTYELFEAGHPGYETNVNTIIQGLKSLKVSRSDRSEPFSVLEVGAGPGTLLTKKLGQEFADKGDKILINEIDPEAVSVLKKRTTQYYNGSKQPILSPNLNILNPSSALDWMKDAAKDGVKVDAIVSNFTMHHFKPHQLDEFFELANKILKPKGRIITGEEHLDYSISNDMLESLGLSKDKAENFSKLTKIADRIVSNHPYDKSSIDKEYEEQREKSKESLKALGLPEDISAMELRKNLRPAAMISYHVGRIINDTWEEGKIKLPVLEFKALASGLTTCDDFFNSMHKETISNGNLGNNYNKIAVKLLDKLTKKLEDRTSKKFTDWEEVEHGATQNGAISAAESRKAFIFALMELKKSMGESKVIGLPNPSSIYDADLRYEDNKRKGGNFTEINGIDYKVTPMEFAEIAAKHGFCVGFKVTGANERENTKPAHILSYTTDNNKDILVKDPIAGSVAVSFSGRANEWKFERSPQR